ncbi:4'-phosphopantetheinyl transferase family protein [Methanococcoides sp. FTZ1]|uniref:4'-phosphopantetheinyl transferase family protein n=1 Tax=Methanococcoides sp. FTZ1 TaxID=3439061 RepID=UPI003F83300B
MDHRNIEQHKIKRIHRSDHCLPTSLMLSNTKGSFMDIKSAGPSNILSSSVIHELWDESEVLIFLADLELYEQLRSPDLTCDEKEYLKTLRTEYFKKRFIVSRSLLKAILQHILRKKTPSEISLYRNNNGRVCIGDHKEIYICISYTRNLVAILLSRQKAGLDIEHIRPIYLTRFSKYFQNKGPERDMPMEDNVNVLKAWTLKEAYCKLTDQSMMACLNKEIALDDLDHHELIVNNEYVLSVVFDSKDNEVNICYLKKGIPIKMEKTLLKFI